MKKKGSSRIYKRLIAALLCIAIFSETLLVSASGINRKGIKVSAKQKYDVSRIIVKYKKDANKTAINFLTRLKSFDWTFSTEKELKNSNIEVINVGSPDKMDSVLDALREDSNVEYAEPNYKITSFSYGDEPGLSQQWGLKMMVRQ